MRASSETLGPTSLQGGTKMRSNRYTTKETEILKEGMIVEIQENLRLLKIKIRDLEEVVPYLHPYDKGRFDILHATMKDLRANAFEAVEVLHSIDRKLPMA